MAQNPVAQFHTELPTRNSAIGGTAEIARVGGHYTVQSLSFVPKEARVQLPISE